jgi:hypothetical protein
MSKLTKEARSSLLSARAKNRKLAIALGEAGLQGVTVPKHVVSKVQALNEWFDSQLTAKPKAETSEADAETQAETSEAVAEAA